MTVRQKPDIEHLRWAVEQRGEIQQTLLALYDFVRRDGSNGYADPPVYILDHLIGAAFSLWRAVFLAETYRTDESIRESQENFLAKVISDNSITFGDDKINRAWTVGYYLDDAKLRIERASAYADHHLKSDSRRFVIHNLRLRGTMGIPLTEWEWESAHFALRYMLRVLDPQTKATPKQPNLPRPEGLEAVTLGDEGKGG
ncbi:hypothetical protein [Afipia sp. DC4300-2b1]|uniref:hypothetical protein n=1 Tax=Afipia sp. DC4300-2b1 TaxID=2804672 RepID=UPI003CE7CF9C